MDLKQALKQVQAEEQRRLEERARALVEQERAREAEEKARKAEEKAREQKRAEYERLAARRRKLLEAAQKAYGELCDALDQAAELEQPLRQAASEAGLTVENPAPVIDSWLRSRLWKYIAIASSFGSRAVDIAAEDPLTGPVPKTPPQQATTNPPADPEAAEKAKRAIYERHRAEYAQELAALEEELERVDPTLDPGRHAALQRRTSDLRARLQYRAGEVAGRAVE